MATTSARSAAGTANLSSVCATSSMNASHSPGVMRRCRCELSMSLPVYFCGPPAAQHSISVTRYSKPAGGTLWCASSTKGLALSEPLIATEIIKALAASNLPNDLVAYNARFQELQGLHLP